MEKICSFIKDAANLIENYPTITALIIFPTLGYLFRKAIKKYLFDKVVKRLFLLLREKFLHFAKRMRLKYFTQISFRNFRGNQLGNAENSISGCVIRQNMNPMQVLKEVKIKSCPVEFSKLVHSLFDVTKDNFPVGLNPHTNQYTEETERTINIVFETLTASEKRKLQRFYLKYLGYEELENG